MEQYSMAIRFQVGEIIRKVIDAGTVLEKQRVLVSGNSMALREIIRLQFGLDKFTGLTKTEFAYTPAKTPYPHNESKLIIAARGFRAFRQPPSPRWDNRFHRLLEGLHREEAEFLLMAVRQELDFGLTANEIEAALPHIFGKAVAEELTKASAAVRVNGNQNPSTQGNQTPPVSTPDAPPVKRGRGRPRKHPLPVPPAPEPEKELTDEEKAEHAVGLRVIGGEEPEGEV
jgi:hypothetical protein